MSNNAVKQKVLIVDDSPENIHILMETLKDEYAIVAALNGEKAIEMSMMDSKPDIILLDVVMPIMDGYEVCARLKANKETANIPIIFITSLKEEEDEAKGLHLGAVDFINKPFSPELVKARIHNHMELKRHRDYLEELVQERTRELVLTQEVTILSLASLAETRDKETGSHIMRTQNYVKLLYTRLKNHPRFSGFLNDQTNELLYKSAPLHDIGKVGVPDSILLKPGKLTPDEFEEIKKHTIYGRDALLAAEVQLGSNSFLQFAREIAYSHHEKWDGTGYPTGIKGDKIPIPGRLMALADVYDALITKRVYKPSLTHDEVLNIMRDEKGKHFDPDILDAFLEVNEDFYEIAQKFSDFEGKNSF